MHQVHHLIDGQLVRSIESIESVDPSTGEILGTVDVADEVQVQLAVDSARNALLCWQDAGIDQRAQVLGRMVDRLREEYGDQGVDTPLKSLICREMGKRLPEADIELAETADILEYFVENASSLLATIELKLDGHLWPNKKSVVELDPIGVVGVIKPWNYPLELAMWSIAPALVSGNTVVFKPSEHSAQIGSELGRLFSECGLPDGVLNVIQGDSRTGKQLVASEGVDMISFTGSVTVGKEIGVECARRHRRFSLELGGNDAAIVASDADLELASNGLVWGAFANSGQVCVRPKRLFVHQDVADRFIELVLQKTSSLRPSIDYGPLVSKLQLEKVQKQVTEMVKQGASVLTGGSVDDSRPGYFYQPTILTGVSPGMVVMKEECFGPVMPIVVVSSHEEAIELANDSEFGLGGSVWTNSEELGLKVARQLDVGMVWINDVNVAFPQAPWGGLKQSGPGVELGDWGLKEYVTPKHINRELSQDVSRDWWFPYPEG